MINDLTSWIGRIVWPSLYNKGGDLKEMVGVVLEKNWAKKSP